MIKTALHLAALLLLGGGTTPAAQLHPVVDIETEVLLGAVVDGKCVKHEAAAKRLKGGEKYRIYGLTERYGQASGARAKSAGEPCDDVSVVGLSPKPKQGVVALAAEWNALPRVPKIIRATQPIYVKAVRLFLEGRGLKNPDVQITQILRVDLDGDDEDEVLISATNYFTKDGSMPNKSPAGSYSFVLLRQVIGGVLRTNLIEGEFHAKAFSGPEGHFDAPARYTVLAVLDIDGDGKMEVIVDGAYYEGGWTTIYRCSAKRIEKLLHVACGA